MVSSSIAVFAAVLGACTLSSAAPLINARQYSNTTSTATVVTSAPASTATAMPWSLPVATVLPEYTSNYNGKTGAVDFHTARGFVSRHPNNGGADASTLVTFELPTSYASNTCQLVFDLTDYSSYAVGTSTPLRAQIFTSLAPAGTSAASWPSGNLRDQELGSIDLVAGGRATWESGSGSPIASNNGIFPCSFIAGKIYGAEILPQGDDVEFSWPAATDGIKIIVW